MEIACEAKTLGNNRLLPGMEAADEAKVEAVVGATAAPTTTWLTIAVPWKPRSGRLAVGKVEVIASRDQEEARCGCAG